MLVKILEECGLVFKMAEIALRCNLASYIFPMASQLWGRSIIVSQYDQNFDKTTLNVPGVQVEKGLPQVYYMHNVLPTSQGYQAIGYTQKAEGIGVTDFDVVHTLIVGTDKFLFSPSGGQNYIYDANSGVWQSISPISSDLIPRNALVTVAFIHGVTYIFYETYGCFIFDPTLLQLTPVTLSGLDITQVKGILSANGYLVAFTNSAIAWSSLIDETDFVPSLINGAGGASVNDARGKIVVGLAINGGFLLYCESNIVGNRYSGNINFPFVSKEVVGSAGVKQLSEIAYQSTIAEHYVWTGSGLQKVNISLAANIFPEVTDFLANRLFEDFDEVTLALTSENVNYPLYTRLAMIQSRFLVISYSLNIPNYTHALVFDTLLNRWGKLKQVHRSFFHWGFPNLHGELTYADLGDLTYADLGDTTYAELGTSIQNPDIFKEDFALVQQDGAVLRLDFDFSEQSANGVFIMGKFQLVRTERLEHQRCIVETVGDDNEFNYYVIQSQDGKTMKAPVKGFLSKRGAEMRDYRKMLSGVNLSSLLVGQFNIVCLVYTFTRGGNDV